MHHRKRCYKVPEYIYHTVCVTRKTVTELQNVDIITFASQGKLSQSCGMYISSRMHHKESLNKFGKCMYYHVYITRKGVIKFRNVDIITCASQEKLL